MLHLHLKIDEMDVDVRQYVDDLEMALGLMANISDLFKRLEDKQKTLVLQIIINRLGINLKRDIVSCELKSPFAYLSTLSTDISSERKGEDSLFNLIDSWILHAENGYIVLR